MIEIGSLVTRDSIGGSVIAAVVEVKKIGTMTYARIADESGGVYLLPVACLKAHPGGHAAREMKALEAMRVALAQ